MDKEIIDLIRKTARKRTKRKYWLCYLRDLGNTESKNILEIKAEEVLEGQLEAFAIAPTSSREISSDPVLIAMLLSGFNKFLRSLSPSIGRTAAVSSSSL